MSAVTVRVWCCQSGSDTRLCIVWEVYLSGLVYLAGKVGSEFCVYFLIPWLAELFCLGDSDCSVVL